MLRTAGLLLGAAIVGGVIGGGVVALTWDHGRGEVKTPDTVVGILKKCTLPTGPNDTSVDVNGPICDQMAKGGGDIVVGALNTRLELTVRTSAGTTYTFQAPPETVVNVGDPWPEP
jgi:hypothetical protein